MDKPIKIVLDNARYQHCKAVTGVAKNLEVELLQSIPVKEKSAKSLFKFYDYRI
jgi:hypothetical protein